MRVLVTGNHGYIGPAVEGLLVARGFQVTGLDTDYFEGCTFFDPAVKTRQIARDIRRVEADDLDGIDAVVHLAALSNDPMGALDESLTDDINFRATRRLAELCKRKGVGRFVYASSCSLYGVADEHALTEEAPLSPQTAYARSKVDSEKFLSTLAGEDFSPTYLRNATAYGVSPRLRVDLVLNNLVGWAVTTGKVRIMSDGTPWRPLVHIEDIAGAILAALEAPVEAVHDQAFNVGSAENNYQIRDMAEMVRAVVPGCEIEYTYEHGGDSRTYNVSFEKINRVLPDFRPAWNLERGVRQLYEAYTENGLDLGQFQGERYVRLTRLTNLKERGLLDESLYWKDGGQPR
jgi:nucleoside-diphosphate-sugar epimerase